MLALALIAASASTPVGVGLDEYTLASYRAKVPVGLVRFNATNRGEDVHDLAIRTPGGRILKTTPEIRSGGSATLKVRLRMTGTYMLLCTIPGHEGLGMKATLRVTKSRTIPR